MTKEWSSPYNEFNSLKILLHKDNLEKIVQGEFPPPINADTDLTNLCNFDCFWCNAKSYRAKSPKTLPVEHLIRLADFYKDWGIKATCVAGGGEPMINPGFPQFIHRLYKNGVKSGVITNGSLMNEENAEAIAQCSSWCGISVDAAVPDTFFKIKHREAKTFKQVIRNIQRLVKIKQKTNSEVEITYKYLLHPLNVSEIYGAARLAKTIGCNTFHLRPVCVDNLYGQKHDKIDFKPYLQEIEKQIEQAKQLEDKNFHFYAVKHKFGQELERKVCFKKCWATPLLATFGADGNVHLCFDIRGKWILGRHYPDPYEVLKFWGSDKHKKMIASIKPEQCPRCTFGPYNEAIEQVIIKNKMFKDFI